MTLTERRDKHLARAAQFGELAAASEDGTLKRICEAYREAELLDAETLTEEIESMEYIPIDSFPLKAGDESREKRIFAATWRTIHPDAANRCPSDFPDYEFRRPYDPELESIKHYANLAAYDFQGITDEEILATPWRFSYREKLNDCVFYYTPKSHQRSGATDYTAGSVPPMPVDENFEMMRLRVDHFKKLEAITADRNAWQETAAHHITETKKLQGIVASLTIEVKKIQETADYHLKSKQGRQKISGHYVQLYSLKCAEVIRLMLRDNKP